MSQHIYATSAHPQESSSTSAQANPDDNSAPSTVKLTTHNQYKTPRLLRENLNPNPISQFNSWFQSALNPTPLADGSTPPAVKEPEAMAISTVSPDGIPSSRMVLLKTVDTGFVFFTNYESRKSQELAGGYASLVFYWREISRQVRVVGRVEKVDRTESEEYFNTRPMGSKIGAWVSRQSSVVKGDNELESQVEEFKQKVEREGKDVECPEYWGGWRIVPL
jgi:pyridoxamine-phosphate oxidase